MEDDECQTVFEYDYQFYPQGVTAYQPYGLECMPTQQRQDSYVGASSHVDNVTFDAQRRDYRYAITGMPEPPLNIVPSNLRRSVMGTPASYVSWRKNNSRSSAQRFGCSG